MDLESIMLIFIILLVIVVWGVGWKKERKKGYQSFNKAYPVGSLFYTGIRKQKFAYGKWIYLGKNIDGSHVFERVE